MASDSGDDEFIDFLRDQLRAWAPVSARRMFGGHGLFRGSTMFGIIAGDTLYLRTDDENRPDFEQAGMPPFRYARAGRMVALGYHEIPADILEDTDHLAAWAAKAYAAALRRVSAARPRRKKRNAGDGAATMTIK